MGFLISRTGPGAVWKQLQMVGWGFGLIIVLGGFAQFVKTCAWRQTFTCDMTGLSWSRSFGVQLASDAVGQLGVAGKLIGEGIRVTLVRPAVPLADGISAGAIDGALHTATAILISVSGIIATLLLAHLAGIWRVYAWFIAITLVALVILASVAVERRWYLAAKAARAIGRLPHLGDWVKGKQPIIDSAETNLLTFYDNQRAAFWASLLFNLLWHLLAILEVYIVLRFIGARIAPFGALVVEGLTKVVNLVGALSPGNLGTYEGGNMLIAKIFGVTGTTGLTLALCRRARALFWAGVGGICMVLMKESRRVRRTAAVSV